MLTLVRLCVALSATLPLAILSSEQTNVQAPAPDTSDIIKCSTVTGTTHSMTTYRWEKRGIQVSHVRGAHFYAGTQRADPKPGDHGLPEAEPLKNPKATFEEVEKLYLAQQAAKKQEEAKRTAAQAAAKKSSSTVCSLL